MQSASIVYLLVKPDGTIIEANQFVKNMCGEDKIGQPLDRVLESFGQPIDIEKLLQAEGPILFSLITLDKQPQTFHFHVKKLERDFVLIGQLSFEELEFLQKNLLETNEELNNMSRDLHKKNAQLLKLNQLKNHFLGVAAHDLRNPLNVITNYCQFLLEESESLDEEQEEIVNTIEKASQFMLKLLNELLDIAKIEAGKMTLDLKLTQMIAFLKENIALNQVIAKKKLIKIQFDYPEVIPDIKIDSDKISQVLNNLISNAIKFSHQNTKIIVAIFTTDKDVVISVKDHGQGIPEEEHANLFKPFVQTSVQSTAGESSTGLGLAIVNKIILAHRGRIWVESEVDRGSIFYFSLPVFRK